MAKKKCKKCQTELKVMINVGEDLCPECIRRIVRERTSVKK